MWFHSYLQVPLQGAQALGVPKITYGVYDVYAHVDALPLLQDD